MFNQAFLLKRYDEINRVLTIFILILIFNSFSNPFITPKLGYCTSQRSLQRCRNCNFMHILSAFMKKDSQDPTQMIMKPWSSMYEIFFVKITHDLRYYRFIWTLWPPFYLFSKFCGSAFVNHDVSKSNVSMQKRYAKTQQTTDSKPWVVAVSGMSNTNLWHSGA